MFVALLILVFQFFQHMKENSPNMSKFASHSYEKPLYTDSTFSSYIRNNTVGITLSSCPTGLLKENSFNNWKFRNV